MKRNRILIVDDNQQNTSIVRKILRNRYDLVDAETGEEALHIADSYRPDIVLLDIMLPGIDGYEVCRRMKDKNRLPDTKVIMVTAKAMIGEKLNGYEAGADDYITKPFDGEELLAKVEVYLRLKTVEEHEALKSNLLTLLGHETRTPMTYVMAAAQNLADIDGMDKQAAEFADIINGGVTRIADILTKALRYGELTSQSAIESAAPCDVELIVDAAMAAFTDKAHASGLTVSRGRGAKRAVMADSAMLAEALGIILDNAAQFSARGEAVRVQTDENEGEVHLSISNKGTGIPEDLLPILFQGLQTTDVDHHSNGHRLNLAIAKAIVENHGGRLTASSTPDQETTFTIALPASSEAPPREQTVSGYQDSEK